MNQPFVIAPGLQLDDSAFLTRNAWSDVDKVRFWRDMVQTIGGWESFQSDMLSGVCRTVFAWTDNSAVLNVAFGTHTDLEVAYGGGLYEITPVDVQATGTITVNGTPTTTQTFVVGSQTFTFVHTRAVAGEVTISATPATQAANIVTAITADIPTIATAAAVSAVVTVTAVPVGTAGNSIVLTESATGIVVSAGGTLTGGSDAFVPGEINGTGGQGWGTGTYSTGEYSEPSTGDFFPLTWSMAAYGQSLIANPRGQTIYRWSNNTAQRAVKLPNSPEEVTYTLVTNTRQVMAFGCNEELSGNFNALCIRFSNTEDPEDWETRPDNLAGEVILEGGGRLVGAKQIGEYINVWTDNALYLGQFTGDVTQPWRFDRIAEHCGLIGPNAAVVLGQKSFWCAPNRQFYVCAMGGEPQLMVSPIQTDFANNLPESQKDKIVGATISEFNEVWWFYPDARDGNENSRYFSVNMQGQWSKGTLARTAFVDAGPPVSPIGVTYEGQVYYHERGTSADGDAISWYAESADQYIGEGEQLLMLRGIWPDFKDQQGPISLTVSTRLYPQSDLRAKGPYSLPPGKNRKDMLLQGRLARVKIAGNSSPTFARLGKLEFDVVGTGAR